MKKTCNNCKALEKTGYNYFCLLGYKMDGLNRKPLEDCPKPLNNNDFCNLLINKKKP
jgi:hypothetical protein